MGLKKYEIITVGSDRRVRALRSWQVGDRYVNIGDVGGIVYDENTLSQDGACWLFRGNFGFPGARIGGDSIVDVGETALSTTGAPNVDILGSSVVVGGNLRFRAINGAEYATILKPADFEQGNLNYAAGVNWETWKTASTNYVRTKSPIFVGGTAVTLKVDVPGYTVQAYVLDRDGKGVTATASTNTGAGVTLSVPAGQYFLVRLAKNPSGAIVPADAATAAITITTVYEGKLVINDSRVEINPATSTGVTDIRPGGVYTIVSGAKYPVSVIQNSKVSITSHATANRTITLMSEVIDTNAIIDASVGSASVIVGIYKNVKNLAFSGSVTESYDINIRGSIRATDCNDFVVSPTIFPGLAAAQTANMPFIFQGCNVPGGGFYHHAQIKNTYVNIDFAKAQADLGKAVPGNRSLVSSEVEGMYRVAAPASDAIGSLVESYESVRSLLMASTVGSYGTTIYKDAYFNGRFDIAGTNVFGNKVSSHPLVQVLNVAPRAVQGNLNTATLGQTVTGVIPSDARVCIPTPFRINGANGLKIEGLSATLEALVIFVTPSNVVTAVASSSSGVFPFPAAQLNAYAAYVRFGKIGGAAITPEDLAGVTVTVYNGCKIVNTGATAVNMKGNIRVEDNATLINSSIMGTGYFGGNAVASGLYTSGCVFMKDNATFVKNAGAGLIRNLKMTDNGRVTVGDITGLGVLHVTENAVLTPSLINLTECDLFMSGNASVTAGVSIGGILTMKDNAKVNTGTLTAYGDITLCGSYNQTTSKSWTGKRVIYSETEPEYDNNVKTQYDF